ncbi:MAG TPA: hypothetical protein VFL81_00805 [Candidatus Saccharimonadales bacterium]|nr:hypothetical protein [Candidatus Saccharimonadales bacterium]
MSVASSCATTVHVSLTVVVDTPIRNEIGFIDTMKSYAAVGGVRKIDHTSWVVICQPDAAIGFLAQHIRQEAANFQ